MSLAKYMYICMEKHFINFIFDGKDINNIAFYKDIERMALLIFIEFSANEFPVSSGAVDFLDWTGVGQLNWFQSWFKSIIM